MSKFDGHTPGPFHIKHEFNVFSSNRLIANCGGHSRNTAAVSVHNENCANAALMAAAPSLLEELIKCVELLEKLHDETRYVDLDERLVAIYKLLGVEE